ncbi:TMEM43 family protein [Desulfosarcina sp. OttesenSCG-928-G10]|nr:TMEM43 family protein [Desulfosarcina sp. OttesenSCG-928-G10]
MAYTETTSVSWLDRLGGSFRAIGLGIILMIAGTVLLWWNEGNFVATRDALNEAQGITQELGDITRIDPSKNGRLVHASGPVETRDMLTDPVFGLSINAIRLERTVEFYQWVEESHSETRQKLGGGEETVTTYTYRQQWTSSPVNAGNFKDPNAQRLHKNVVLTRLEDYKAQAKNVTFGAYRLPEWMISAIYPAVPLNVNLPEETMSALNTQLISAARKSGISLPQSTAGNVTHQDLSKNIPQDVAGKQSDTSAPVIIQDPTQRALEPPIADVPLMVHVSVNTILLGMSPGVPQVGDVRVTFTQTLPGTVSILGQCNGHTFEKFRASNDKTVGTLEMGTRSLEEMYDNAHSANTTMTWILRVVGAFLVIFGLGRIVAPLEVIASVIPLLGRIVGVGTGIVSLLLGLAWSLIIIAIAWLRFRPVMGLGMLGD